MFDTEIEGDNTLSWTLTRSELSCLSLTASGNCVETIARQLSMTIREVELVLYCAQRKLNADNRMQAICLAMSLNLISNP